MARINHAETGKSQFLYKDENVTLREEVNLTEQQRLNLQRFRFSDCPKAFIDVFPTTILVHKKVAERKFGVKRRVFVTGQNPESLCVLVAPSKFCCVNPIDRAALCPPNSGYVNMEKCDLRVITAKDDVKEFCGEKHLRKKNCFLCSKGDDGSLKSRLFSISCGHFACRACWLVHCKWELARGFSPISCPYGDCNEKLTISRAAALLSDSALAIMVEYEWEKKLQHADSVRCAGCQRWLEHTFFHGKIRECGCACGCYTCVKCGQRDHTPLRCDDAAVWAAIRSKDNGEESAAEAEKVWSLTREDVDECLVPSRSMATTEFESNIRFMRTHDRVNGRAIDRDMASVAIMLEMRRAQQLARRQEMQPLRDYCNLDREETNKRWERLDAQFNLCLDTRGETKTKAIDLGSARQHVMQYYHH